MLTSRARSFNNRGLRGFVPLRQMSRNLSVRVHASTAAPVSLIMMGKLVEVGKEISNFLAPSYDVQAFVTEVPDLMTEFKRCPDKPKGLLIGGAFSDDEVAEATSIASSLNPDIKVVRVTAGTLEAVGPSGVGKWIKDQLDQHDWNT